LDTDGDRTITNNDSPADGMRLPNLGISKTPVWLDDGSNDPSKEGYKIMTGTTGRFASVVNGRETTPTPPPTPGTLRRRTWIQIR
jgi:hypothetical protein